VRQSHISTKGGAWNPLAMFEGLSLLLKKSRKLFLKVYEIIYRRVQ